MRVCAKSFVNARQRVHLRGSCRTKQRLREDGSKYPFGNINTANPDGVMWYLTNEVQRHPDAALRRLCRERVLA